jgi:hypothetical protein
MHTHDEFEFFGALIKTICFFNVCSELPLLPEVSFIMYTLAGYKTKSVISRQMAGHFTVSPCYSYPL